MKNRLSFAALFVAVLALAPSPLVPSTTTTAAQTAPARPKITGVAGLAVKVRDLAMARNFYSTVLGLDEAFTIRSPLGGSDLTAFKINDRQYVYVAADLKDDAESRLLFASYETDDARALRAYLASRGVAVPAVVNPDPQGNLTLLVKDPEGNNVEFIQFLPGSTHVRNAGRFLSPRRTADHALHIGYRIRDVATMDTFYKDVLGFRLMWAGGNRDDVFSWISMLVPDGNQWLEYMVDTGTPTPRQLGVWNHLALGTHDIQAVQRTIVERGYTGQATPAVNQRDGRWLMHLFDPDLTRTEFMIRKPVQTPCCSPLRDVE